MVVHFCIPYILTCHLDFKVKSYFLLSSCKEIYIIHIKAAIMNCFSTTFYSQQYKIILVKSLFVHKKDA